MKTKSKRLLKNIEKTVKMTYTHQVKHIQKAVEKLSDSIQEMNPANMDTSMIWDEKIQE